jgi:hypothetical protein
VGQQAVELDVQAGEAVRRGPILGGPPRHRQGRRQVGLLGEQVGGPVAHAAGVAQQDLCVVAHHVEQGPLVLGEPRQPRLHAVEHETVGQALPLLAPPWLEADQPLGPLADLVGGQQLTAREQQHLVEPVGRPLVGHRELGEPVDLVAPQVDAHRAVGRRREHVDDRPAHGQLAPVLDHLLAPVASGHEVAHQVVAVDLQTRAHRDRRHVVDVRAEALHQGPHRGHHHGGRPLGLVQSPQHAQAPAHRLDPGADALERQRLPRGEQLDRLVAEEGREVVRHPLGLGGRGHGQHDRSPLGQPAEARRHQGARRLGHGQGGRAAAQHLRERGLVAQGGGEVGQGRASARPRRCGGGCHKRLNATGWV